MYTYDNSTTEECNELIESFEKSPAIRFLWTNIKPLIRGKILFTPNTPATRYPLTVSQGPRHRVVSQDDHPASQLHLPVDGDGEKSHDGLEREDLQETPRRSAGRRKSAIFEGIFHIK